MENKSLMLLGTFALSDDNKEKENIPKNLDSKSNNSKNIHMFCSMSCVEQDRIDLSKIKKIPNFQKGYLFIIRFTSDFLIENSGLEIIELNNDIIEIKISM